jgi:acid phosphatase (class A)
MRLAVLLLALAAAPAWAEKSPGNHYEDPVFLSRHAVPVGVVMPPPPRSGSPADRADFDRLFEKQRTRTPAEEQRASHVVDVKLGTLFGPPDGPLTADEVRRWAPFFERVQLDADYFNQEAKKHWKRPRPFQRDPRIRPAAFREWTYAYPSGHATISWVFAKLLSELDPSLRGPRDRDRRRPRAGGGPPSDRPGRGPQARGAGGAGAEAEPPVSSGIPCAEATVSQVRREVRRCVGA